MKKPLFLILILISLSNAAYPLDFTLDLMRALQQNEFDTIEKIISANIGTMSSTKKRIVMNLAINHSSGENTLRVLELLNKYNIRPSSFDLFNALDRNRQDGAIQFILRNGGRPNGEMLLLTMERQRFDLAKQFIESGVDVNFQYALSRQNADGMTPLLYAVKWNNIEMVKLLTEKGADLNAQAVNGDTALSIAKKSNNDAMANYLIDKGAIEIAKNTPSENNPFNILDNQLYNFQAGSYILSGGNKHMRFTGNANTGTVNYIDQVNNRMINGYYQVAGNNIIVILDGYTSNYRLTSNESFYGNGEVWARSK